MKDIEFAKLTKSLKQAGRIRKGVQRSSRSFDFAPDDIKAIRQRLGKSQTEFAMLIGVSAATLRNWEQGRRNPEGPARALLRVAAAHPRLVAQVLTG